MYVIRKLYMLLTWTKSTCVSDFRISNICPQADQKEILPVMHATSVDQNITEGVKEYCYDNIFSLKSSSGHFF